jgi:4-nitrophenyl phosphatase
VLTSGFACGRWLRERLPERSRVMVVGEEGLLRELREAGFVVQPALAVGGTADAAPAAVVVGMDRSFTYGALAAAQAAVMAGALYVATNNDATFPTADGLVPGAGAIVAAVSAATQREPVLVGKPALALAEVLATVTGVPAEETLFVGDRLTTDVAMAKEAGMTAALVLSGVTTEEDLWRAEITREWVLPDHVLSSLEELPGLLELLGA